ncbi:Isochorismatase_family protein [Hexamita inflata]|uniref:Isochorismatase family protein n=1 Tax=Hexamita inflata TaxID=28002 RepID=A0AA86PVI8_9EUKA|nr:Isochorismatase family protein [Hexamita inflata]CAI9945793.1 Isochorismatase family protein [Hexamita inflata]
MKALLLIDYQNDYFKGGKFPLWDTENVVKNSTEAIKLCQAKGYLIIHVQHIANSALGLAPFFNKDTDGVKIYAEIVTAAPNAPVVIKDQADSFLNTNLEKILAENKVTELIISGMMTQNCVTHTAISKAAEKYKVSVLADCCTTVDQMIHLIALGALSARVEVKPFAEILK